MSWRPGPEETLIHPRRGKAPACPEGYEQTIGNPFVVKKILPVCEHREDVPRPNRCCGYSASVMRCLYFDKYITRSQCARCEIPNVSASS